jgi:hypothetical protein
MKEILFLLENDLSALPLSLSVATVLVYERLVKYRPTAMFFGNYPLH